MYFNSQEAHWTHDMWLNVLYFPIRLWRVQVQRVQHLLPRLGPRRHGEALRQRPRRHRRPLQVPRLPRSIVSQVGKKTNKQRKNLRVVDFPLGCDPAQTERRLRESHPTHSFDHINDHLRAVHGATNTGVTNKTEAAAAASQTVGTAPSSMSSAAEVGMRA